MGPPYWAKFNMATIRVILGSNYSSPIHTYVKTFIFQIHIVQTYVLAAIRPGGNSKVRAPLNVQGYNVKEAGWMAHIAKVLQPVCRNWCLPPVHRQRLICLIWPLSSSTQARLLHHAPGGFFDCSWAWSSAIRLNFLWLLHNDSLHKFSLHFGVLFG